MCPVPTGYGETGRDTKRKILEAEGFLEVRVREPEDVDDHDLDVSMRLILRSEKLIPFLQYQHFVGFNDPGNLSQVMRPKSMIDRQPTG